LCPRPFCVSHKVAPLCSFDGLLMPCRRDGGDRENGTDALKFVFACCGELGKGGMVSDVGGRRAEGVGMVKVNEERT
jgi:hypothetical protein